MHSFPDFLNFIAKYLLTKNEYFNMILNFEFSSTEENPKNLSIAVFLCHLYINIIFFEKQV